MDTSTKVQEAFPFAGLVWWFCQHLCSRSIFCALRLSSSESEWSHVGLLFTNKKSKKERKKVGLWHIWCHSGSSHCLTHFKFGLPVVSAGTSHCSSSSPYSLLLTSTSPLSSGDRWDTGKDDNVAVNLLPSFTASNCTCFIAFCSRKLSWFIAFCSWWIVMVYCLLRLVNCNGLLPSAVGELYLFYCLLELANCHGFIAFCIGKL